MGFFGAAYLFGLELVAILYIINEYYMIFYEEELGPFRCLFPIITSSLQLALALAIFRKDTPQQLFNPNSDTQSMAVISMIYITIEEQDREMERIREISDRKQFSYLKWFSISNLIIFGKAICLMSIEDIEEFYIACEYDRSEYDKSGYIKLVMWLIFCNIIRIGFPIIFIGRNYSC